MVQAGQTKQGQAPVAIIGFGTAGVNAAIGLRNAGYEGAIDVFTDTNIPPYSPILTSYYAGGEKTYEECFPWPAEELDELELTMHPGHPVTALDTAAHLVRTDEGDFPYAKCIIATGSRPMAYGFPQVEGFEPIRLRTMDDAERLKNALEDPDCKRFLVSGASMVALKTLEAVLRHGIHVTLVGMSPHVLDFNALPEVAELFERSLVNMGVELRLGMVISEVEVLDEPNERGRLRVTFSNGDVDYFDNISVAHGMKSNLELLEGGGLAFDRAVVVDEFMRTEDPDVYAAGDVAQGTELITGEKRVVGIWKNAAEQGAVAGAAIAAEMAGNEPDPAIAHPGAIAKNTILVNGVLFISAGTMEITENRHMMTREEHGMFIIYIYEDVPGTDEERLVGFNIFTETNDPGGRAYEIGAMLTMRIEQGCREKRAIIPQN